MTSNNKIFLFSYYFILLFIYLVCYKGVFIVEFGNYYIVKLQIIIKPDFIVLLLYQKF